VRGKKGHVDTSEQNTQGEEINVRQQGHLDNSRFATSIGAQDERQRGCERDCLRGGLSERSSRGSQNPHPQRTVRTGHRYKQNNKKTHSLCGCWLAGGGMRNESPHLPFVDLLLLRAVAPYALDAETIDGGHLSQAAPPLPHAILTLRLAQSLAE